MGFDPRIHHRRSIRLPGYDYSQPGAYYVTLCTCRKECIFDDKHLRGVVERAWSEIVNSQARIEHGDFVVMPSHLHGVVWVDKDASVGARHQTEFAMRNHLAPTNSWSDPTQRHGASPLRSDGGVPFSLCPGSLGAIVGSFKSSVARRINNIRRTPGGRVWQRGYYEHVIRGEDDLRRVREYILDNPRKWPEAPENPANPAQ